MYLDKSNEITSFFSPSEAFLAFCNKTLTEVSFNAGSLLTAVWRISVASFSIRRTHDIRTSLGYTKMGYVSYLVTFTMPIIL